MRRAAALVVVAAVLLLSGCNNDPQTRMARDVAGTVRVDGFRKVGRENLDGSTIVYFVGPADADLQEAVRAHGFRPEPLPTSGLPDAGAFQWVIMGSVAGKEGCRVMVGRLRPGFENDAIELSERQSRQLNDGTLAYVEVAVMCRA